MELAVTPGGCSAMATSLYILVVVFSLLHAHTKVHFVDGWQETR